MCWQEGYAEKVFQISMLNLNFWIMIVIKASCPISDSMQIFASQFSLITLLMIQMATLCFQIVPKMSLFNTIYPQNLCQSLRDSTIIQPYIVSSKILWIIGKLCRRNFREIPMSWDMTQSMSLSHRTCTLIHHYFTCLGDLIKWHYNHCIKNYLMKRINRQMSRK